MNSIKQMFVAMNARQRQAFWMGLAYSVLMLFFGFMLLPDFIAQPSLMVKGSDAIPLALGVLSLVGTLFILRGYVSFGGRWIVIINLVAMVIVAMLAQGYGPTVAVMAVIISTIMATQTQSEAVALRVIVISLLIALTILLIDTFWPLHRLSIVTSDVNLARLLALILALIYGAFVATQFNNLSLTIKVIITALALTLLPMAAVGLASNYLSSQALVKNADQSLTASASQVAAQVDSFILNNLDIVRTEAKLPNFVSVMELSLDKRASSPEVASALDLLNALQERDPVFITSYALLDVQGNNVADTSLEEAALAKLDRDYARQAFQSGLPTVSPVRHSPISRESYLYFSAPVRNSLGDMIGLLRVRYNAAVLQQILLSQGVYESDSFFAMLVSDENVMLAHTDAPELISRSIVPLNEAQAEQAVRDLILPPRTSNPLWVDLPTLARNISADRVGISFTGEFHEEDGEQITGTQHDQANTVRLKTLPWTAVVAQPVDVLLAPVTTQERGGILLMVMAAVVSIAAAITIARFLTQPLVQLTAVAKQVAAGDLSARAIVRSHDEIGTLAGSFNQMASELNGLVVGLEQRVADRTKALAASAEVSRRLSTILDQSSLVKAVVDDLQRAFGYYHVHIYLLDDQKTNLVLAGGTGEAAQVMLARQHQIARGRGLVGRAAESGVPVLVPDVTHAEGWLPNPLLPETLSELAVPILLGDQVLGVLDVQQNRVEGLKQEDSDLLQSIASQVAIALQNARAYAESQRSAAEMATVSRVATAVATIANPDEMLQTVVDLTKASFDLYHAHIYLLNEAGDTLLLNKGAGEVGRQMVAEGRQIALNAEKSLVARAARLKEGVIVNDVRQDPEFLPHPLLPDTRSEMAVPMLVGDQLIGVLDVQANIVNRFTQEDVMIKTTLSSQTAIALQNARQYEQSLTSERLIRSVIDATPDWIFIKDQQHRYRLVNQGYSNSLHIQLEDFIGKNDLELGFPEELVMGNPEKGITGFWADDRGVMDSGEAKVYPNDLVTIDGELRTFNTIKTPVRDANGTVTGILAFGRDVTERETILKDTEVLYNVTSQLSSARTYQAVLAAVVEGTAIQSYDSASIYFFDHPWTNETLPQSVIVQAVWEHKSGSFPLRVGQSLPLQALPGIDKLLSSPYYIVEDARTQEDMHETVREMLVQTGMIASLNLRLIVGGEWVGCVAAISSQPQSLSEQDGRRMITLVEQAATALYGLLQFEATQARVRREQTLREITNRVRSSMDTETILRSAVRELGTALGRQTFIRLGSADQLAEQPAVSTIQALTEHSNGQPTNGSGNDRASANGEGEQ